MKFHWICLLALVGFAFGDDSCPDAKEFKPCTCDGEGVNCMNAQSLDDIRRSFSVKFKYGATRAVWVQGTPIKSLPADLFGEIKSQQFNVEVNEIETVDLNAFRASKKTLTSLSLYGNKIIDFPYSDLEEFTNLGTLNLGKNKISSLPENAFNSRSIWVIILAQNEIKHIGPNAFANLPKLGRLELSNNVLKELGPMSMASKQHSDQLQVSFVGNQISEVAGSAFQGFAPYALFLSQNKLTSLKRDPFEQLITRIAQKGGFIELSANPLSCSGCDYSWIALNKELLAQKLVGFTCKNGRSIHDLTRDNIGCV